MRPWNQCACVVKESSPVCKVSRCDQVKAASLFVSALNRAVLADDSVFARLCGVRQLCCRSRDHPSAPAKRYHPGSTLGITAIMPRSGANEDTTGNNSETS